MSGNSDSIIKHNLNEFLAKPSMFHVKHFKLQGGKFIVSAVEADLSEDDSLKTGQLVGEFHKHN